MNNILLQLAQGVSGPETVCCHQSLLMVSLMSASLLFCVLSIYFYFRHKNTLRRYREHTSEQERIYADLQTINSCLRSMIQEEDLNEVLAQVLKALCIRTGACITYSLELDVETRREILTGQYVNPNYKTKRFKPEDFNIIFDPNELWYQCLLRKQDIYLDDLSKPEQMENFAYWQKTIEEEGIKALYVCGLWTHDKLYGDLGLIFTDPESIAEFSKMDKGEISVIIHFIEILIMRRQSLESLKLAMERAGASEKAKSLFLASMSHEIRTPLNAMIGFSELLTDRALSEEVRNDYLQGITYSGNALLSLINDVLDLSKLEAGGMVFNPEPTLLADLLREIVSVFQQKCDAKEIRLLLEIAPDFPVIEVDKLRIRQLLLNLTGNAVKFTEAGSITIRAEWKAQTDDTCDLSLSVIDTGIGIAPEYQQRVFGMFEQVHAPQNAPLNSSGTGLGLALCRQLVEKMNGEIHLTSQIGQGSNFSFTLHGIRFRAKEEGDSLFAADENKLSGISQEAMPPLKVLLTDDVPLNLKVSAAMLTKLGVSVETAGSATGALEKLAQKSFDILLTDLWMPDMNGLQLAAKIRESKLYPNLRIGLLTADTENLLNYDMSLIDGTLNKPITLKQLDSFLRNTQPPNQKN